MSSASSGKPSSGSLRRFGSGRNPPFPCCGLVQASVNGSRMPCAEYSKVSNCCITGSGSSGCAGRARSPSTHFSRLGASPGVLVTPRPQAASNRTANAIAPRAISLLRLHFGRVQVAIGLDRAGQLQRTATDVALGLVLGLEVDVVHGQDHHPRQRRHATDERAELVVAAHHPQLDRLLGVELLALLLLGLEQLVGQAAGQRGLRDVDDQVGHFRLARQLPQHLLQHLLHLRQLLLQRGQVHRAFLLLGELGTQLDFLRFQASKFLALAADQQHPRQEHDHQRQHRTEDDLGLLRPVADVVEIEVLQIDLLAHARSPCSGAMKACGGCTRRLPSGFGAGLAAGAAGWCGLAGAAAGAVAGAAGAAAGAFAAGAAAGAAGAAA
ncbi:hypothetical protein G6F31_014449 [Rhizopus arrhizus]|nr:hypothetical protein G6F31_014449 [Rhizopus arrhizus]